MLCQEEQVLCQKIQAGSRPCDTIVLSLKMHVQQAREDLSSIRLKNLHHLTSEQDVRMNNFFRKVTDFRTFFKVQKNLLKEQKKRVVHSGKTVQKSAGILQRAHRSPFRTGVRKNTNANPNPGWALMILLKARETNGLSILIKNGIHLIRTPEDSLKKSSHSC